MKAILIMHNIAIDEDVNNAFQSAGVNCYSKFTNVLGRGGISEPHLNTEVWPEINYGTFVVTDQAKAEAILNKVRELRKTLGAEGVKAFMWEIEEVT